MVERGLRTARSRVMRCSIGGREKARGEAGFSFRGRGALLLAVCGEDASGEVEGSPVSPQLPHRRCSLAGALELGRAATCSAT